jgi:4-amino-4-deoxy-L-arabinose transferase-like glycosyltransferase
MMPQGGMSQFYPPDAGQTAPFDGTQGVLPQATSVASQRPVRLPEALTVASLGVFVLLVRLAALMQPQRMVWGDEPFYLWLGRNWLTGQGYSFTGYSDVHHSPMYPLLTGVFYLLTHNMEVASDICYVLFGVLLVLPIYLLAKEMYGRGVGVVSVLLLAIYPAIATAPLFWGTLTEPPYYFFVYAGLWLVLLAIRRGRGWQHLLAGMCFGLAYLTRPEAVAYVAIGMVVLVLVRLFEKRSFTSATLTGLALYLVGFLLFFGPYAFYVHQHTGSWMISEKAGVTFVTGIGLSEGNTAAFDRATWGLDSTGREVFFFSRESYNVSMLEVIRAHPQEFVQLLVRNVRRFADSLLSSRLFPYFFLPLVGLAFFQAAWDKARAKGELLLLASLTPVLAFLFFFIQDRYIATLLPTLVIWLGLGAYSLGDWLRSTLANLREGHALGSVWRTALVALPTLALLLCLALMQPRAIAGYTNIGSFRIEHKTVGLWLKDNIPHNSVVMSRFPAIAFYGDTRWEPTPNADYARVLVYAKANGVTHFVLDEEETRELRPQFAFLLNKNTIPPELELLHVDDSARGQILVFRFK